MIAKNNTHGVMVLYYPDGNVMENVRINAGFVRKLYVIDNSDTPEPSMQKEIARITGTVYIAGGENKGIAWALNRGAGEALKDGAEWLLTMDQDSRFGEGVFSLLTDTANSIDDAQAAIFTPFHRFAGMEPYPGEWEYTDAVMTSGNLLNLGAYKKCGPFEEKLFIDYVDWEYCLRLRRNGYRIVRVNKAVLEHPLGDASREKFLFVKGMATHHSYIRRYYITRNRFYIWNKYKKDFPALYKSDMRSFRKELVKIILFEKNKGKKLKMVWKGYRDYKKGRLGKL